MNFRIWSRGFAIHGKFLVAKNHETERIYCIMYEQVLFFMNHMSMYLYYVLLVFALVVHHFVEI